MMDSQENALLQGAQEEQNVEQTAVEQTAAADVQQVENTKVYKTKQEVVDRLKEIVASDEAPVKEEIDLLKTVFYKLHIAEREARLKEYIDVSNIGQLPSSPYNLRFAYAANNPAAINFADINSVPEMQEFYLSIKNNTGSTITQPIPNGSGWQSDEASIEIEAGKTAGVSIKKEHGIMVVRV